MAPGADDSEMMPSPLAAIDAVCFDFDGTLARYRGDFERLLDRLAVRLELPEALRSSFCAELTARLRTFTGSVVADAVRDSLAVVEVSPPPFLDAACGVVVDDYAAEMTLLAGAAPLLELLEQRGVPLALITNGPEDMQRAAIAALGLTDVFRTILISGDREVAVRKPHPRIFRLACEALGAPPERTLMVGDRLEADVGGALAAGLQAIHLGGEGDDRHAAVPDLWALRAWLEPRLAGARPGNRGALQ